MYPTWVPLVFLYFCIFVFLYFYASVVAADKAGQS